MASGIIRWIADQWERDAARRFLWLPVLLGIGVVIYFALPAEPPWGMSLAMLAAAILGNLALPGIRISDPARVGAGYCGTAFLTIMIGFCAAQWQTARLTGPALDREKVTVRLTGTVAAIEPYPQGARILLSGVSRASTRGRPVTLPARVRVRITRSGWLDDVRPGDAIALRAVLRKPAPPVAPWAFDFRKYAFFHEIGAVGFAIGPPRRLADWMPDLSLETMSIAIQRLRLATVTELRERLPNDQAALAAALIVGERKLISDDTLEALRDSGLAHLLAISGLHIGLIAGLILFTVRLAIVILGAVGPQLPAKKIAAVCAILGALGYLQLAGATIPTQRAFIMVGIALMAILLDRTAISMRTVALGAMVVILIHPASVTGPSFQMSFAAVTALVAVYEALRARRRIPMNDKDYSRRGPLGAARTYVFAIMISTLVAGTATAPFAAFHFNRVADYSLLANLIAIPLVGFWVMPMALLGTLLMPLGLSEIPLHLMGQGIAVLVEVASFVAGLDGAVTLVPAVTPGALSLWVAGFLWICLWVSNFRWFGAIVCGAAIAIAASHTPPDLLVDRDGKLIAVRQGSGDLSLPPGRSGRFTREIWLERAAQERSAAWPSQSTASSEDAAAHHPILGWCDGWGCAWTRETVKLAWILDPRALAEDCRHADIVITPLWLRTPCPSARLILDGRRLRKHGAHAIWLDGDRIATKSTAEIRGSRPWTR